MFAMLLGLHRLRSVNLAYGQAGGDLALAEIARRIAEWIDRKEMLPAKGRAIRAGDVMVLVRRRGTFLDALVRALKQRGVPVAGADRILL